MTIKFFGLFFYERCGLSPVAVSLLATVAPFLVSGRLLRSAVGLQVVRRRCSQCNQSPQQRPPAEDCHTLSISYAFPSGSAHRRHNLLSLALSDSSAAGAHDAIGHCNSIHLLKIDVMPCLVAAHLLLAALIGGTAL